MFDVYEFQLASNVADAGTVAVAYKSGRTKGSYDRSNAKHKLSLGQRDMVAPADFTVSFGSNSSGMTVTNASGGTWFAGEKCYLQVERVGANEDGAELPAAADQAIPQSLIVVNLGSPAVADADGVCASQSVTASEEALINGALASGGEVVFDYPRNVVASWTGTAVLTITGKDDLGNTVVEKSASGTSHTGKKAFKKITSVVPSANITSATVGSGDVLGLPVAVRSSSQVIAELLNGTSIAATPGRVYLDGLMLEAAVDAGTARNLVSPVAGRIRKLTTISQGTITTGGDFTVEVNTVAVTGLTVTVADGAVEGEVDSDTPTAGTATAAVAVGDRIEIIPSAGFNASADIYFVLEIDADPGLNGTLVTADGTEVSGTTGDVRGTYDPLIACDGSTSFALLVRVDDPSDVGLAQYAG